MKLQNLQTLIIGPNDKDLRDAAKVLQDIGVPQVEWASNIREALLRMEANPKHLIICDKKLGNVNGISLLKLMRQQERFHKIAFVLISNEVAPNIETTENETSDVHIAVALGVSGYFLKPLELDHFRSSLEKIIERIS